MKFLIVKPSSLCLFIPFVKEIFSSGSCHNNNNNNNNNFDRILLYIIQLIGLCNVDSLNLVTIAISHGIIYP